MEIDLSQLGKQLKALQKESEHNEKESEFYKTRFNDLRDEVKKIIGGLGELIGDVKIRTNRTNIELKGAWKDMKINLLKELIIDGNEIFADRIEAELVSNNMNPCGASKTKLRQALTSVPGITSRYAEGRKKKILSYDKTKIIDNETKNILRQKFGNTIVFDNKKEELGEIKIEKTSYMG